MDDISHQQVDSVGETARDDERLGAILRMQDDVTVHGQDLFGEASDLDIRLDEQQGSAARRRRGLPWSSPSGFGRNGARHWKQDSERCSAPRGAVDTQVSTALSDDTVDGGKPQTRSAAL